MELSSWYSLEVFVNFKAARNQCGLDFARQLGHTVVVGQAKSAIGQQLKPQTPTVLVAYFVVFKVSVQFDHVHLKRKAWAGDWFKLIFVFHAWFLSIKTSAANRHRSTSQPVNWDSSARINLAA